MGGGFSMELSAIFRKLGPTNFILLFLFPVLCIYEFFDGRFDVGDYGVALLFALFLNDIYLDKLGKGPKRIHPKTGFLVKTYNKYKILNINHIPLLVRYPENPIRKKKNQEKVQKILMNIIFTFLLLGPLMIDGSQIEPISKSQFYKWGIMLWASCFLALSFYNLRGEQHKFRKVYLNLALVILVGSVIFF